MDAPQLNNSHYPSNTRKLNEENGKSSIAFVLPFSCLLLASVVHVSALDSDVSGDLSGHYEVLSTNETSSASDIGVPLDVVDKVFAIVTQVIASLKDLVLKVPFLCVILYPVIIILEIIVIYIPGGFPCPIIIGIICKYLGNAIPVWTPIKFIKVDITVILGLTTTIKLLQSVIILVTPNSCIFLVLNALVNILKSVLALLYLADKD
ncbi:hypothetical protein SELMODRAFT_402881 [Selaginella moellendorffii]|uniref:Transmembrane protein n=1 Tax=Selaginella moellendorffii TaxID=88036 RepID=D8QNC2_SELML|nr:hypothetical protein SELMODRAFT_402881 [Selaginella moellendorffii]